ncbi:MULTISPECIES: LytR/AlgR family response regulator transcription factor [Brevibacillus]|jgi:two-component system response regulator LytT|uniref:LytR/AlgR family response regulator transcription factor n=1 Tax=Brevibacillus TaxID=55080 RepID=UPI0003A511FE|nr:LytTR family DNA-binding domain-containing protein [Brevibacillus borstelensis]MBE5394064.1 response regulator transcription factor [Brevibacillus borstelensis]MCC0565517.1 LytTR family DNA-binding domain-containing protein [Brevibacillus borstelensis]MCM3468904.1 LytTR family DNA-binding domain-containing protein [Brevibacillus borstelensis]MCM3559709.1 LytTR family DNA-binding domain-containing protein [Brevibacillus borstelensis]MCM3591092.1 LytTR family DNA-binding domain-containing pro
MLKVFIVDDEAPARAELRYLLEQFSDVAVIGEAESGEEALELIPDAEPDAVFLDIHLHDRDGVDVGQDLLELMVQPPVIIFASAYEIHAVRAFETEAVDYIVKPFSEHRLEKTINRVRKLRPLPGSEAAQQPYLEMQLQSLLQTVLQDQQPRRIPVERNGKIMLIDPNDIVYATVDGRYASIHTEEEQYATSFTLQELESRLSPKQFFRTHRAFIANLYRTAELVPWFKGALYLVMQDAQRTEVPVSRNVVKELKKRLGF